MTEGLPAAEQAANAAALSTPEAEALASELAARARADLPSRLSHVQAAEALAAQTAQDIPAARTTGETTEYAKRMLLQRAQAQLGRYAIPAAGAAIGAAFGGPVGAGLGAAAGRGISPGVRAVVGSLILSPEAKRLAAAAAIQQPQRGTQISGGSLAIPAGAALSAQEVAEMLRDDSPEDRARVLAQLLRGRK